MADRFRIVMSFFLGLLLSNFLLAQQAKIDSIKHLLKTAPADTSQVYLRNELGRLFVYSKPDTTLILTRESFAIAGKEKMQGLVASTHLTHAIACNNMGVRDSAVAHFKLAIQIAAKHKRTSVEAAAYLGLGTCYGLWKKHNLALQNYLIAYNTYRTLGDSAKMASAALGIGNVYSDLNNIAKAQEYFTLALNSGLSRNDTRFVAKCYNNLGSLFQRVKDYDKAFEYYTKSIEMKKLLKDEHGIANTYLNFGNIYTLTNKIDLALLFYQKANVLYLKVGDSASYMGSLTYMAECYLKSKNIKEGIAVLKTAEGICIRNHYTSDLAGIYGALTKVYILQGDTGLARVNLEKYTAVKDTLLTRDMQKQISQMSAQYENDKQKHELALQEAEMKASSRVWTAYLVAAAVVCVVLVILLIVIGKLKRSRKMPQENEGHPRKQNRA